MGEEPVEKRVTNVTHQMVEFLGPKAKLNTLLVHHYMQAHGMTFCQAVDYFELRENYHFVVRPEKPSDEGTYYV